MLDGQILKHAYWHTYHGSNDEDVCIDEVGQPQLAYRQVTSGRIQVSVGAQVAVGKSTIGVR